MKSHRTLLARMRAALGVKVARARGDHSRGSTSSRRMSTVHSAKARTDSREAWIEIAMNPFWEPQGLRRPKLAGLLKCAIDFNSSALIAFNASSSGV